MKLSIKSIVLKFFIAQISIFHFYKIYYAHLSHWTHNLIYIMEQVKKEEILLDIGGTLVKVCYVAAHTSKVTIPHNQTLTITKDNQKLYFMYFKHVQQCWLFLNNYFCVDDQNPATDMIVTGGGAYKYDKELKQICEAKHLNFQIMQEFQSLIAGLNFFRNYPQLKQFVCSVFTQDTRELKKNKICYNQMKCPILVVNVGSGVSILKVIDENGQLSAERVGGTSLGGGFFMGLANLLTGQNNFHKLLEMAQQGDVSRTDIIPSDFPELSEQFSEASVLVSLGKLSHDSKKQDIVKSLFYMVTFNIAQISISYSELLNIDNVLFTGFYCRQNEFVLQCFAEAFTFFTKNTKVKHVYSMQHDGFLGALGALNYQTKS